MIRRGIRRHRRRAITLQLCPRDTSGSQLCGVLCQPERETKSHCHESLSLACAADMLGLPLSLGAGSVW